MRIRIDILILVLLITVFASCKKNEVGGGVSYEETPIMFSAYSSGVTESEFVEMDEIGVYMIEKDKASEFNDFRAVNYGYLLQNDRWKPILGSEVLSWKKNDNSLFLYSYSPRAKVGSRIEEANGIGEIKYNLPLDQSSQVVVDQKKYDLLMAVSKGPSDNGWTFENVRGALPLPHQHALCKIHFDLFVVNLDVATVKNNKANIKSVKIISKDIAQTAVMSIKDGAIVGTAPVENITWFWNGSVEVDVFKHNVPNPTYTPIEFIVNPFVASLDGTKFEFEVEYTNASDHLKTVIVSYTCPDDGSVKFTQGKKSVFRSKIALSDSEIEIGHTIVDWGAETESIIGPAEEM